MCSLVFCGTFFGVEPLFFLKVTGRVLDELHISLKKQSTWRCSKQVFSLYSENLLKNSACSIVLFSRVFVLDVK